MNDEAYMRMALTISRSALPLCLPNPPVGCVLVRDSRVLSKGYTHEPGGFHAEAHALSKTHGDLKDVTAYVTLEPCAFKGRTPSCAVSLAECGISRVVIGLIDPDPRNNGKGIAILREAKITVVLGILGDKVSEFLGPYLNLPANVK